jgi:hypothetical protein
MSDGITEARRGTYFKNDKYDKSIINWELHQELMEKRKITKTSTLHEPNKKLNIEDFKHMPNQKWHKYVSFLKSGVRILGYAFLPFNLVVATIILIFSEIIGIVEELV